MKTSSQEYAYVSSAIGGSLSQVSFEGGGGRSRINTPCGEGARGDLKGFSRASRRNLLRKVASIDRSAFRAYNGRVFSVTLTYPHEWPEHIEACKGHLKSLRKRLTRAYGTFSAFWRLGIQKRGTWHFHLLLFVPPTFGSLKKLRHFVGLSWWVVCGKLSEDHLLAGTHVQEVKTWKRATSFVERYVAKPERFSEGVETGRIWGTWNEKMLPVRWETTKIRLKDAYRIRRIYRRLAKMRGKGHLCRLTVFVRHENVVRLLDFLGYPQEE